MAPRASAVLRKGFEKLERAKADSEMPEILQAHGLNEHGSRSRLELADSIGWREAKKAKKAISKLDAERGATGQPASFSILQSNPTSPPAPRRKSSPSGP